MSIFNDQALHEVVLEGLGAGVHRLVGKDDTSKYFNNDTNRMLPEEIVITALRWFLFNNWLISALVVNIVDAALTVNVSRIS